MAVPWWGHCRRWGTRFTSTNLFDTAWYFSRPSSASASRAGPTSRSSWSRSEVSFPGHNHEVLSNSGRSYSTAEPSVTLLHPRSTIFCNLLTYCLNLPFSLLFKYFVRINCELFQACVPVQSSAGFKVRTAAHEMKHLPSIYFLFI